MQTTVLHPSSWLMRAALVPAFTLALLAASPAADGTTLRQKVEKAAANLPRGCIVAATQTGGAAPVVTVAGRQEPAGVPPEKVIFEIGSISKVFTGILLAQAVIEKKVTLDSTLREVMGPRQRFADDQVAGITLKQLATHTSGLPRLPDDLAQSSEMMDPYVNYSRSKLDACIAKMKLPHAPPFRSEYSNLGAGLLGDLLSRVYGADWEKLVVERIAKPLGMTDTCVTLTAEQKKRLAPPYDGGTPAKQWRFQALAGAGALYSTTADMLRFAQALGRPGSTLLKEAIEMTATPHDGKDTGLFLMLSLGRETEYWYQGGTGGYRSWISVNPATQEIVTMLINNSALSAEDVLFDKAPADPADPALAAYAGAYDTGAKAGRTDIHYTFEVRGSDLWLQITGQPFIQLSRHPTAEDRFEFKPVKAEIQFTRRRGEVVSTTLFQSGQEIHARKLPERK